MMEEGRLDQTDQTDEVVEGRLQLSLVSGSLEVRQSLTSGPLEETLDTSQSSQAGILDKYLLSQSSQSIDNFLTPSLGSVQSGLLETSSLTSAPLDQTDINTLTEYRAVNHSNRSSLVLSEDDMRSVTSLGGSDMENMMLEVGKLDASQGGFETVLAHRDAVIQKLSASLNKLMMERKEDGEISRKLEVNISAELIYILCYDNNVFLLQGEVLGLKDQVALAIKKAAANKEYKDKYKVLVLDNEKLNTEFTELSAQTSNEIQHLQSILEAKKNEISKFESSKNLLLEKLQTIQTELMSKSSNDESWMLKVSEVEAAHMKEIEEMKDHHEHELQQLIDKHEEEQVVEFNLLDYELDKLRDEKQDLLTELNTVKAANEILKQETVPDSKVSQGYRDSEMIKERLAELEVLYSQERRRAEELQESLGREREARESLETDLVSVGSVLDDTQYQFLPHNVRESLERSVRLSLESGALSPSRRASSDSSYQISDQDVTPTHRPSQTLEMARADHVAAMESMKADHELEMSELRRYFENVCREMELKYRAETEETIPARNLATPAQWNISGPISLELGTANVEFEFESMSPRSEFCHLLCNIKSWTFGNYHWVLVVTNEMFLLRSGFSSDNQQLSFSSVPAHHSRNHSGLTVSDAEVEMSRTQPTSQLEPR